MKNNNGFENLEERFGRMVVRGEEEAFSNDNSNNLFQVMKAVEAAEATIKQQVEENNRLRNELYKKEEILEKIKLEEATAQRSLSAGKWDEYKMHQSVISASNQESRVRNNSVSAGADAHGGLALQHFPTPNSDTPAIRADEEKYAPASKINGTMKVLPAGQVHADNAGLSQLSSPSTTSLSAGGYHSEGEHDPRLNLSGYAMMQMSGVNNPSSLWKQDLSHKTRVYEDEIMILRKRVAEYSIKEAQLHNEKYVLEKRIAHMRLAFDQQQQDLVDAASKAISYRQDIIEENIRLTYALQSAQEDRSTYVSSLLPILAEYSLQPQVPDAPSIVSNLKVLLKHFQEKLNHTETKLKESQYQLTPWQSDMNPSNVASQSPSNSLGTALTTSNKNGLELVPQSAYSEGMGPIPSTRKTTTDLLGGFVTQNLESDDSGRFQPFASRPHEGNDPTQRHVTQGETRSISFSEEPSGKQVTFSDNVSTSEIDHPDTEGIQNERESPATWRQGGSTYAHDDTGSYSPYLPPVLEEPSSSFSEAADDDPLPAIEGLQISGDPYPGHSLQACGYSINGTTSCNFEWVRHWEDGSVNYIEGAKQPNYLVTADDVNAYLAIEVQPLDNRKRKGELVKVFANEHQKISCEQEMHTQIERALLSGHASFRVSLSTGYLDIFEPATLAIKREGFSIKCSGPSNAVVTEKFSASTTVTIPYGQTEFLITGAGGVEHFLRAEGDPTDVSCSRETIVLILRYFISRGELVKVFANEHQKISCEQEMHTQIERALLSGHASFRVSLSTGYLDIFEPATLAIKREGFSIKCSGPSNAVVTEKFSASTTVTIPYGQTEFLITGAGGVEHFLRAEGDPTDVSCSRETIVLILRYFISRAGEKKGRRKKGLFFK